MHLRSSQLRSFIYLFFFLSYKDCISWTQTVTQLILIVHIFVSRTARPRDYVMEKREILCESIPTVEHPLRGTIVTVNFHVHIYLTYLISCAYIFDLLCFCI